MNRAVVCNMKRDGKFMMAEANKLVVGDIIRIEAGEAVPADCLVLEHYECMFSEAGITGEPDAQPKSPATSEQDLEENPDPFILASSLCESGRCTALVLAVGEATMTMRSTLLNNATPADTRESPLEENISMVTKYLPKVGWIFSLLILAALLVFATIGVNENKSDLDWICDLLDAPIIFIILIGLVCLTDIGIAKSLCLARSTNSLMKDNVYLRRLQAVETMAYCNEVVTDTTGILT